MLTFAASMGHSERIRDNFSDVFANSNARIPDGVSGIINAAPWKRMITITANNKTTAMISFCLEGCFGWFGIL